MRGNHQTEVVERADLHLGPILAAQAHILVRQAMPPQHTCYDVIVENASPPRAVQPLQHNNTWGRAQGLGGPVPEVAEVSTGKGSPPLALRLGEEGQFLLFEDDLCVGV